MALPLTVTLCQPEGYIACGTDTLQCGSLVDMCGRTHECGGCDTGETCINNLCCEKGAEKACEKAANPPPPKCPKGGCI
jgi:hypothetical protein